MKKHDKLTLPNDVTIIEVQKSIDNRKKYKLPYLAPHQSTTKDFVYGEFELQGRYLTENQIIGVFLGRWNNI